MNASSLAARFRQVLAEHEHGALGGIDLAEALAQAAVAALTTPQEGDALNRVAQVVSDALDAELPEDQRTGEPTVMDENVATALLAAFPVLGRDIAGEIEALNAEIQRLQKRNSDMSWALYPDRMGQ